MNGLILLLPFLLIRFGLLRWLNQTAISRAAHFAPMIGKERIAYIVYQLSNFAIFFTLYFLSVNLEPSLFFYMGALFYILGLFLMTLSLIAFAKPTTTGCHQQGIYRYSRHPMYLSYFVFFTSCALLTQSWILYLMVLVFQITSHWIILAEERWCIEQFKDTYVEYMKQVHRYL